MGIGKEIANSDEPKKGTLVMLRNDIVNQNKDVNELIQMLSSEINLLKY